MADINAEDLTEETAQTLDGSEQFVMFDSVEGKRGNIDVVGDYIAQHADADGQGHTAAQLAASAASIGTAAAAAVDEKVGTLTDLTTTDKTNLVAAVNEVDAEVATKANESELGNYAKVDGTYESLTAGNAEQLISASRVTDKTPYIFRRAGGGLGIGDRKYTTLVGADVAVNQMVSFAPFTQTRNGVTAVGTADGVITLSGTSTAQQVTFNIGSTYTDKAGHKILIKGCPSGGGVGKYFLLDGYAGVASIDTGNGAIRNAGANCIAQILVDGVGVVTDGLKFRPQFIDLTAYFGLPSIADTAYTKEQTLAGSGIAWLKANGFDFSKYIESNAGSLEAVNPSAIVTRGFNQWDGTYADGYINATGGVSTGYGLLHTGYIKVLPNTTYCKNLVDANAGGAWYDADKNFISLFTASNQTEVSPSNARYFRQTLLPEWTESFCINLSKTTGTPKNGDYRAYSEHEYALGNVPLHGVFKEENGNIVAYGDTRTNDGTVNRKFKKLVFNGTENWGKEAAGWQTQGLDVYYIGLGSDARPQGKQPTDANMAGNIVCSDFTAGSYNNIHSGSATGKVGFTATGTYIEFTSTIASLADWKTALGNKNLEVTYEIATPTTDTADPFASPQVVDADGTEEFTVSNDVPVGNVTEYPENLREKLENLPEIPNAPSADGTYTLKATVSGGAVTYSWE